MLKNYFKTAWRNITRNKGYSALNILGLAMGMAVALLIGLWVYNEYSYDKFLPDHQRLYQVRRNYNSNGEILTFSSTSLKLADALRSQVPEIEYVAETDWISPHGLAVDDNKFYMSGGCVGSDFLKMFRYQLLEGNAKSALTDIYSIVLTQATAKALFKNENAIGKMVRIDNKNNVKVTGILKDLPLNSSLQFSFLLPFSYLEQTIAGVKNDRTGGFDGNSYQQFLRLKPGASYEQVSQKIKDIEKIDKNNSNAMNSDVIIQPISDWHLFADYKNGKAVDGLIQYVRMFSIIGGLVLLIACINFVNLTTARSEKRAREVGVRKAIGSQRKDLIIQFLAESMLLTFFAFIFSLLFVQLALPAFNSLTRNALSIPFSNIYFWLVTLACLLVTAVVAGSRPAFYLSSFNAVKVLKGNMHFGGSASLPRKALIVIQFSCSIALIIGTISVYRQIQHAKERSTGYDINRLLITDMNDDLHNNFTALKNDLLQQGIVTSLTTATSPTSNIYWHADLDFPGKFAGESVEMGMIGVSDDYFKTLGMTIADGRDFIGKADSSRVVLNEAAIKRLRLENPINQGLNKNSNTIVGVVKDALMLSPFAPADPTLFAYSPRPLSILMYRLSPHVETQDAIARLTEIFNKYSPGVPYVYQFADVEYAKKFNTEVLVGKLAAIFACLAILISCLGLFGLAAYTAEQRTREIGIRKVLGASVSQVWLLLSKDFIILVIISNAIAAPLALYFLEGWLQKYSYRINIGAGVFIMAAMMALLITLVTISFQAISAAVANPVKSLRGEG